MDLKTSLIPGVLFPGIPALNSRETGMQKIREFPIPGFPADSTTYRHTNIPRQKVG